MILILRWSENKKEVMRQYKTQKKIAGLIFMLSSSIAFVLSANVALASDQAQDLLISKLTSLHQSLADNNPAKVKITLRLADLHAEKGRLQAKHELEKGCVDECTNGEEDRRKALKYYGYALPKLKDQEKIGTILVEMGHLYELIGRDNEALKFYKKVISRTQGSQSAEARLSLAEIYFKQRNYANALEHYKKVLKESSFKKRGLATFRLAWCRFNTGDLKGAIAELEKMLKDPKLLVRGSGDLIGVDQEFQSEVARDYTIFVARDKKLNLESIQKVFQLSPKKNRIENVSFLAKELERLGRVQQSEQAWNLVIERTDQPQVRMEALVYLAGVNYKTGKKQKLLSHFQRALSDWNSLGKVGDQQQSEKLKKRLRYLLFNWNRREQKTPSKELLEAYKSYFLVVTNDLEAFELASQVATQLGDYAQAYQWNQQAMEQTQSPEKLESLLVRRVEIAELSKNPQWLLDAQNLYLQKSTKKSKLSEIRYQIAQSKYDNKEYEAAAKQFYDLAMEPATQGKLRLQAAELALDSMVFMKNDQIIEAWSRKFAEIFPEQKKHFLGIAGQSVLSQAAQLSNDDETAWATLGRFDVNNDDPEKVKIYYKDKIILARKLKKFDEMNQSISVFLGMKNLTKKEVRFALENKVWLDELRLDFDQAYLSYKKLNTGNWLQLARFADLAEKPSKSYYFKYLKTAKDSELAFSICLKLLRESKTLRGPYKNCIPHLKKDENTFASLLFDIHKKKSAKQILDILKIYGLEKTTGVAFILKRERLLNQGEKKLKKLKSHKLNNRRLAGSLKQRLKRIKDFEKVIGEATKTQDWLTQVLFLSDLKVQYDRFYKELIALPIPKGLSEGEQKQYADLLGQQAAPYQSKASQIQLKLDELWKNEKAQNQIYTDFHRASASLQSLLGPQIERLKAVVQGSSPALLNLVYRKDQKQPTITPSLLKLARDQVRKSPMDKNLLKKLIHLEMNRGYQPMIIYLNSRLQKLDQNSERRSL